MTAESSNAGRPTVLIVEDHADSRAMYVEYMRLQFTVLEAADGVEAIEVMGRTRPDVVVTDLSLPRMDGFELIRRTRATPTLKLVGVIALSGYSTPEHEDRARQAGADLVLQKPCLPEALAEAIASAAARRREEG